MGQADRPFVTLVYGVALALMLGYLLVIGKKILVPILFAIILCYILLESARGIGRVPGLTRSPTWAASYLYSVGLCAGADRADLDYD